MKFNALFLRLYQISVGKSTFSNENGRNINYYLSKTEKNLFFLLISRDKSHSSFCILKLSVIDINENNQRIINLMLIRSILMSHLSFYILSASQRDTFFERLSSIVIITNGDISSEYKNYQTINSCD